MQKRKRGQPRKGWKDAARKRHERVSLKSGDRILCLNSGIKELPDGIYKIGDHFGGTLYGVRDQNTE